MRRPSRSSARRLIAVSVSACLLGWLTACATPVHPAKRDPRLTADCQPADLRDPTYAGALEALSAAQRSLAECTCRLRVLRGAPTGRDCR